MPDDDSSAPFSPPHDTFIPPCDDKGTNDDGEALSSPG